MNKINSVLEDALKEFSPDKEEIDGINLALKEFLNKLEESFKVLGIGAEVFVGGSFAKNTLVKKGRYDIDIFARFEEKYRKENLSKLAYKALKKSMTGEIKKIHGSRDYFRIEAGEGFYFEVVPVLKVSNPEDADNITDLSYYHVNYINKRIKNKKILDDIILAKKFCHACKVYGAESHIKGFSGYSIELLIYHYKGFVKFLKSILKSKEEKIIIDIEKDYKNKREIMMDMNSSKLESPIILIDPTYKQRNALATLSYETFEKLKEHAREFLENPDISFFEEKNIDFEKIKETAKLNGEEFIILNILTEKQEGAVAGSKLLKFYDHLSGEIFKHFDIKNKGFEYDDEKNARCYFSVKRKDLDLIRGPPEEMNDAAKKFKKEHKKSFVREGILYSEEKFEKSIKDFILAWKVKNKKLIKDMYISNIKIESKS